MSNKLIACNGIVIRADEVLFAHANTGDTSEVHLKCGKSIILKMCIAGFHRAWENALKEDAT